MNTEKERGRERRREFGRDIYRERGLVDEREVDTSRQETECVFCVRASFRMIERAREKRTDREGVREVREEHKDLSVCMCICVTCGSLVV